MSQKDSFCPSSTSYHIISQLLTTAILPQVQKSLIPKQIVFTKCSKQIQDIQQSVVNVERVSPDIADSRVCNIVQDVQKKPSFFKIKRKICVENSGIGALGSGYGGKADKSMNSMSKLVSIKSLRTQNELLSQTRLKKTKKNTKITNKLQKKQSQRSFPSFSSHIPITPHFHSYDAEDQIIKALRQNKIFQSQAKNKILQKLLSCSLQKQQSSRKNRDTNINSNNNSSNQAKKYISLTTDYDGFGVPVSKNQGYSRQIPHFIDVEVGICDTQDNFENVKANGNSFCQEYGLGKEFVNYKELKIFEKQNKFVNTILRKIKFASVQNKQQFTNDVNLNSDQSNTDHKKDKQAKKQQRSGQLEIKFSGKTFQPTKVGFNTFIKLKKQDLNINELKKCIKQQQDQEQQRNNRDSFGSTISILKKISNKKKQSGKFSQSFYQSQNQNVNGSYQKNQKMSKTSFFNKNNKKSNIQLGSNPSTFNYLLLNNCNTFQRKCVKKTVTIDQNFL